MILVDVLEKGTIRLRRGIKMPIYVTFDPVDQRPMLRMSFSFYTCACQQDAHYPVKTAGFINKWVQNKQGQYIGALMRYEWDGNPRHLYVDWEIVA